MDAVSSRNYPTKRVMIDILTRSPLPKDVKIIVLSMLPLLPEYLTTEILLRLPVKSLSRFKSVCRQWQRIITSPSFINCHFHRGSSFTSKIVHWCGGDFSPDGESRLGPDDDPYHEVNSCSVFCDGTLEGYKVPHLTGLLFTMRGPCNGIFCVIRDLGGYRTIALWNPATRWFRPLPSCPYNEFGTWFDIDFGVDPQTGDYKIVFFHLQCRQRQFSVFNSRNDSWNLFEDDVLFDPDHYILANNNGCTFLNGVFYRMKIHRKTRKTSMLSFDMGTNSFQEVDMPQILDFVRLGATLDLFDDTLALLNHSFENRTIDIWLMKEQWCWTKHKTVSLPLPFAFGEPIGIWKRNQIYICGFVGEVIIFDLDSGSTRSVERLGSGSHVRVSIQRKPCLCMNKTN